MLLFCTTQGSRGAASTPNCELARLVAQREPSYNKGLRNSLSPHKIRYQLIKLLLCLISVHFAGLYWGTDSSHNCDIALQCGLFWIFKIVSDNLEIRFMVGSALTLEVAVRLFSESRQLFTPAQLA